MLDLLLYKKYYEVMAKMGRPKIPKMKRQTELIVFRATVALSKALNEKAKQKDKTLGTYIRDVLQSEIERSK